MSCWLKQSTAVDIAFGPFLDSADGNTVEGALTITQPDIRLKKNGGAWGQKNAAQTLTHEENGWYEIALNATDTDTLGILIVAVHESGALPVWREFLVVPANVYDSFFSTDLLQVDATQILGDGQSATDLKDFADAGYDPSTNKVQGVVLTDTVTTYTGDTPQTGDSFARIGATGSGLTSLASQASVNAIDDFVDTEIADIQSRLPAALVGGRMDSSVGAMAADVITAAATAADYLAEINAECDTALADYDAPTFAELDARTDAIEADTQDIQARLPAVLVSGRMDSIVGAVAANAINDAGVAGDMDSYAAKMWIIRQSTTKDEYGVTFYKNGHPLESGITSPLIDYVKKLSDGSILVNDAALTDQSNGDYYYGESTNKLAAGNAYMMRVTATIDGSSRVFKQQIGRDSA